MITSVLRKSLNQLHSLTNIDSFSWLSIGNTFASVQEVPGSIPSSGKNFYVRYCVFCICGFALFVQNTLFVKKFCKNICNVISI